MTARLLGLRSRRRVTRSAISHWERGSAKPTAEHLLALGEMFLVPVDYFFEPLPNYLFGVVSLPHTRRGKPPLPQLTMLLEPALQLAGVGPESAAEPEPVAPGHGPELAPAPAAVDQVPAPGPSAGAAVPDLRS